MKSVICESDEQIKSAISKATKENLKLASVSNAGLPEGKLRLIFTPINTFNCQCTGQNKCPK